MALVTALFLLSCSALTANTVFKGHFSPYGNEPPTGNPNGDLRIQILTAYNLIVDSNVESPPTYAPEAFHAGVQFCNDGTDTLWNIFTHIGDFDNNAPGIYPTRTHPGLTGTFSFIHEGGSAGAADASRFVKFIPPGECVVQYWLLSYPRLDDNGNTVTQGIKPDDDLYLDFDVWATANDNGTPLAADDTRRMYMRNEISAMANKIWPNTDSKVPDQYLAAISEFLGWDISGETTEAYPGESFYMQGIWYDLGNVNHGFDNNGDFVADQNAWMQPVGDPAVFNPDCFRLLGVYGLVIVKLVGGGEQLIPFKDRLYFENLPENNGAVGLVFYRFAALDGPCVGSLTPYQEVASGADNEKFNGDYGRSIPLAVTRNSSVAFSKTVDPQTIGTIFPDTLTYTLTISNDGLFSVGAPEIGIPLVMQDSIPFGMQYLAGSANAGNVLPSGVSNYTVLYSTDQGNSWTTTEPAANLVTNIRWQLANALQPGASGSVSFKVKVQMTGSNAFICNSASASYGASGAFAVAEACALASGNNSIGDTVWKDDGGTTGIRANGAQEGNETGLQGAIVSLYYDFDEDGALSDADIFWGADTTNASGQYLFLNLPDGRYVVVAGDASVVSQPAYLGWGATTVLSKAISLDPTSATSSPVSNLTADFGFSPSLLLEKELLTGTPDYEGQTVGYLLEATNLLQLPDGTAEADCRLTAWAGGINLTESNREVNPNNAIGAPNSTYASATSWHQFRLAGNNFNFGSQTGAISKVELLFKFYASTLVNDETVTAEFQMENNAIYETPAIGKSVINQYVGSGNAGVLAFDVTATQSWTWTVFDAAWWSAFASHKTAAGDGATPFIDAIGVRVTPAGCLVDDNGKWSVNTIDSMPLVDTYDPTKLQFVSASIEPNSTTPAGTLIWENIGPLHAKQTQKIVLTFKALQPSNLVSGDTTNNTVNVTGATLASGNPANDASDVSGVRILRSGSIAGTVWSDLDNDGWQGSTGYESGEPKISNVAVVLHTCTSLANNNTCNTVEALDTIYTDVNGNYLFEGLEPAKNYYIQILTASMPGTPVQRGDPDDHPGVGSGNGGTCGSGGGNVPCNSTWTPSADTWFKIGTDSWNSQSWDVTGINFGYSVNPALYGNVWEDNNGDGIQGGEDPLAGVTVELRNGICTPNVNCTTTTTNANGDYTFGNLTAGTNYTIVVKTNTLPSGGTWSETFESDASINNSISVTPTAGLVSGSHDFAFKQSGSSVIGNLVYVDFDGDGVHDPAEEGITNVTLYLYEDTNADGVIDPADALVQTVVTDAAGAYSFTSVPAGDYIVVLDETTLSSIYTQTGDPDEPGTCSACDFKSVVSGVNGTSSYLAEDFGYLPEGIASLGDLVWVDKDGDGLQAGPSETGISGITVELWVDGNGDGNFTLAASQATDADGFYLFENLPDGTYRVFVDIVDPDLPTDAANNSYSPTTPTFYEAIINDNAVTSLDGNACSDCDLDADFGFAALGVVGDFLFWDADQDGSQDWNEEGIPGISVLLYDSNDQPVGGTVTSDGNDGNLVGFYSFTGLLPGDYYILVMTNDPDLGGATLMADPSADGIPCSDPSANQCDSRFDFAVGYGSNFTGVDFGYAPPGVIGDFVWLDADNDGVQDAGEPGLFDLPVKLTNQTGVTIGSTFYPAGTYTSFIDTDPDGYYAFYNLPDGTWTVEILPGSGYTPTYDVSGAADNSATVVLSGGSLTSTGNAWCTQPDCSLDVDFGLKLNGSFTLSGNVCLDDGSGDGVCSTGGETQLQTITVHLYNIGGDYLGSVQTNGGGAYTFSGLSADTYIVATGTAQAPLSLTDLTTDASDTPASSVTVNAASVYQTVPVSASVTGVDFAFEFSEDIDFGDLPGGYSVLLGDAPVGAYHILPTVPNLYLGSLVDGESNGVPSATAVGDDNAGSDDDDGIIFNSPLTWTAGANGGSVNVTIFGSGWLVAWMDFNGNGSFADSTDMIINQLVNAGTQNISFDIPAGLDLSSLGQVFSRFRLFMVEPPFPQFAYAGEAVAGEVEDYRTVLDENEPPVAIFDKETTLEETPVLVDILANDSDPDGNLNPSSVTITEQPTNGMVTVHPNGTITYTPSAGFTGQDTLIYQVCDDGTPLPAQCDTALVLITVTGVNDPPVADFNREETPVNTPVLVNILANDSDTDGNINPATVIVTNQASHGIASVNPDGSITYTPDTDYVGYDTLIYQVCDDGMPLPAQCDTAIVFLTINLDCNPLDTTVLSAQICQGDTFAFGSQNLTASGVYFHTFPNALGCDSTLELTLTVMPLPNAGGDVILPCAASQWHFNITGGWQVWSQPAGANAQIDGAGNATNLTLPGAYLFQLTQNGCVDEVTVHVPAPPGLCVPVTVSRN